MIPAIQRTRLLTGAATFALVTAAWGGVELWQGMDVRTPDTVIATPRGQRGAARTSSRDNRAALALLEAAVDLDPFREDRSRPPLRYGEVADSAPAYDIDAPIVAEATMRLVGTVVDADAASFAVCQVGGEAPQVVKTGGRIGAYRLTAIRQGSATFTHDNGESLTLRVDPPGTK